MLCTHDPLQRHAQLLSIYCCVSEVALCASVALGDWLSAKLYVRLFLLLQVFLLTSSV